MFSIIITTHNSEKYIENTLKNVFQATKNIKNEIIIVDDGSNDDTFKLLQKYKDIQLISQCNKGVSSARNNGLKYISKKSKFLTFIDDSDWVSNNFFEKSINFFNNHKKVLIAVTPITILENNTKRNHFLNYRFKTSQYIINIFENYDYPQFNIGGVVFRSELLLPIDQPFDETINFWEDAKLINNLLLKIQNYGLIKDSIYYYNRDDSNSLAKSSWNSIERYSNHLENNLLSLISNSIQNYGYVIKYVQHIVTLHYLEYLFSHNFKYINIQYILKYNNFSILSKKIFTYVNKKIIDELHIDKRYKFYLYKLKDLDVNNELNYISVYVHRLNLFKKTLTFSFSEESFNISDNSNVFLQKNITNQKVLFLQKYEKDILHHLSNDFSRNIYSVNLNFIDFFKKNIFIIKDYDKNTIITVSNVSVFKRILKTIKLQMTIKLF